MNKSSDIRPSWMRLNPQVDHFDPFEDIGIIQEDKVSHTRYGIHVCNHNLFFDKTIHCEAALKLTIYPVPNVPSWIYGMINLRGNIIPVFGIDQFLTENEKEKEKDNVILVIGEGNDAMGLSIDKLPVSVEVDEEIVKKIPPPEDTPEIFSNCITSAYDIDNKIWLEIDIITVLNDINS